MSYLLITLARNFAPLGASHPWFPRRRKEIRPPYWPPEKQVASMPPWAGGVPSHMRDGNKRIIQRATIIANKLASPLRQISHPLYRQAARRRQATDEFQTRYRLRPKIERIHYKLVKHGLHSRNYQSIGPVLTHLTLPCGLL